MIGPVSVISRHRNFVKDLQSKLPSLKFLEIFTEDVKIDITSQTRQPTKEKIQLVQNSEIVIGDSDLVGPYLQHLNSTTKWIQLTWAGVEKILPYFDPNNPFPFTITRFSGKHYGRLMSEHVVSSVINFERDNYTVWENQKKSTWSRKGRIFYHRSIADLTFGVMGVGSIGIIIASTLQSMGGTIWGLGRRSFEERDKQNDTILTKYFSINQLPEFLKGCDYIINVLPSTTETVGLLNGDVLLNCIEKKPILINIGRGTIISEDSVIDALSKKYISAAYLDVFEKEPLDASSKLWTVPNVYITPHVGGVHRARDFIEFFIEQLEVYKRGEKLSPVVDFKSQY